MKFRIFSQHCGFLLGVFASSALLVSASAYAQTVQEYPLAGDGDYFGIAATADGNLWFSENTASKIGIYKPDGSVVRFNTPTANSHPRSVVLGPDNNVWFLETGAVATINSSDHSILEFPIDTRCNIESSNFATDSTALWFAQACTDSPGVTHEDLVKVTRTGAMSRYIVGTGRSRCIDYIAKGSDDNIWFAEFQASAIGRFNKSTMTFTEFATPTSPAHLYVLAPGSDGNLWFFEDGNKLARIDTSGASKEFAWPDELPDSLILGPDNNLWTVDADKHVWRVVVNPDSISTKRIPTKPQGIGFVATTNAPDGNIWFTGAASSAIGVIRMDGILFDNFEGYTDH